MEGRNTECITQCNGRNLLGLDKITYAIGNKKANLSLASEAALLKQNHLGILFTMLSLGPHLWGF